MIQSKECINSCFCDKYVMFVDIRSDHSPSSPHLPTIDDTFRFLFHSISSGRWRPRKGNRRWSCAGKTKRWETQQSAWQRLQLQFVKRWLWTVTSGDGSEAAGEARVWEGEQEGELTWAPPGAHTQSHARQAAHIWSGPVQRSEVKWKEFLLNSNFFKHLQLWQTFT